MVQDPGFQKQIQRMGELVEQLESGADPAARATAKAALTLRREGDVWAITLRVARGACLSASLPSRQPGVLVRLLPLDGELVGMAVAIDDTRRLVDLHDPAMNGPRRVAGAPAGAANPIHSKSRNAGMPCSVNVGT